MCIRDSYKVARNEYKTIIMKKKLAFKQKTYKDLMDSRKDSAKFWGFIRGFRKSKTSVDQISIHKWEEHFRKVFSSPLGSNGELNIPSPPNPYNPEQEVVVDQLDEEISKEEVANAIKKLKAGRAAGEDQIPPEFIKYSGENLLQYLTVLFNTVFKSDIFPETWATAIIVPIYKKGKKTVPDNFRGISLLSIISKIYTSMLPNRLYFWAEDSGLLGNMQAGFRKNYATTDHIFTLSQIVSNCLYGDVGKKYTVF